MNKAVNTSDENEDTDTREKGKRPETPFIYDYIMKTQALNADKVLIKSVIVKLTLEDKIVNQNPPQNQDSFYNSTKVADNTRHYASQNQIHYINSSDISSSILSKTASSVENNLPTPIREVSITNSKVPINQINIESPSDYPVFKENAPHIHKNIDTPKREPESGDILHCSKISKMEAKFAALKSHVTCEVTILANKVDSFL